MLCKISGFQDGDYEECRFWDVTSCGSCKNRRFGGTYGFTIRVKRIGELWTTLAVTSNRSTLLLDTLMMEAIRSPETSVFTRATRRNITDDGILQKNTSSQTKR
jgi:hypothetical protein